MKLCLLTGLLASPFVLTHATDLPYPVDGTLTITVSAEGEFSTYYNAADIRGTGATRLKVIGPLNDNDFNRVASVFKSSSSIDIRQLDLSEAVFTTMPESTFYIASNYGTCYLSEIVLPEGLTAIPGSCFSNCRYLSSVNIPSTVTSIGSSAFYGCSSLPATLTINVSGPLNIGSGAYSNGVALTTISIIAGGDVSLGDNYYTKPFTSNQLTTFELHTPGKLTSCNELFTYSTGTLVTATLDAQGEGSVLGIRTFQNCRNLTSVTLPAGLTDIPQECFETCTSLESLTIPSTVTSIGQEAFKECKLLGSITFPSSLTSIGQQAFYQCTSLGALDLSQTHLAIIGQEAFRDCSAISSILLPDGITSVGSNAFRNCSLLTAIDLSGATMTQIPTSMCEGCIALSSILLPATVSGIGNWAFYNCKALTTLDLSQMSFTAIPLKMCYGCELLSTLHLPANYTSIGEGAFYQCKALTTFDIPSTVTAIGQQVFYQCSSLQAITIPEGVTEMGTETFYQCTALTTASVQANVATLPASTFSGCSSLTTVTLNDHITELGSSCFSDCGSLTGITLPSNLTTIGSYAFNQCYALSQILLPTSLRTIGGSAFYRCIHLAILNVPEGVTKIPTSMLEGCWYMQTLYLPSTVTEIGERALRMCPDDWNYSKTPEALIDVHVAATTPPTIYYQRQSFSTVTLYVPEASIASYAAADIWKGFKNIYADQTTLATLDDTEYALLQTLYTKLGGSNWINKWTFGATKAETPLPSGVRLNDGHVVQLLLNGNNLSGKLPVELMQFPQLWLIDLSNNQISGKVDDVFNNMSVNTALTSLNLNDNQLTGNIGLMRQYVGNEFVDKLPNLSTLKIARNRIRDVKPVLPTHISTSSSYFDIGGQDLTSEVNPATNQPYTFTDFSMTNREAFVTLFPSILAYKHSNTPNYYNTDYVLRPIDSDNPWAIKLYKDFYSNDYKPTNVYIYQTDVSTWNHDAPNTLVYLSEKSSGSQMTITFDFAMGDVNYDGHVNVSDLQKLINFAIRPESAQTSEPFNFYAANSSTADDADELTIDVLDVITEVNLLLDQDITPYFASRLAPSPSQTGEGESYAASLAVEEGQLVLYTSVPVAALDISLNTLLAKGSALSLFSCKSRGCRSILYSLMGDVLPVGRTVLGTVGSDASVEAAQLCDIDGQAIATSIEGGETTGIRSVCDPDAATSKTFDLQGRRINGPLKKGVFVTNGKKVIK